MAGLFQSKKFWMAIVGVVSVVLSHFLGIDEATTTKVAGVFVAYLLGQGMADFGKESKR